MYLKKCIYITGERKLTNTDAKIIVVTSGKGGVGKTTTSAAVGAELARLGYKTVIIDFDIGLRNLDLIMGCERRVIYDFINVVQNDANLNQALIKDRREDNLFILPASQTRDKDALTLEGVEVILNILKHDFDYIICDSPAGIEKGALMALYFADEAIIVTNPEISSVRDSDRMIGVLNSRSKKAELNQELKKHLLITRYSTSRVQRGEMLSLEDVQEILSLPLLGIIPESPAVLNASNQGTPVTLDKPSDAKQAYQLAVAKLLGKKLEENKKSLFKSKWFESLRLFRSPA
ncbi:MAG: minD [Francisellaceae bacterium]|nr:minD [Francisellaceae bacterium]